MSITLKNSLTKITQFLRTGHNVSFLLVSKKKMGNNISATFPEEIITLPILQTSKEFKLILNSFMRS